PRTDDLAVVASIDAVAHERTQLFGDRPEVLDREIGDAAARVELVRSDDRARGADVDAALARAAVRARGGVGFERKTDEELAEKEVRARIARKEERVLAAPSEPALRGERDFHHRSAIGEDAIVEWAELGGHALGERLQLRAQHLVVVAAERVARDEGAVRIFEHLIGIARIGA